jgi:hypothetical protein
MESAFVSPQFEDGLFSYKGVNSDHKINIVFDIREIKYTDVKQTPTMHECGWTIFPLFDVLETDDDADTIETYVNSGIFAVINSSLYFSYLSSKENQQWSFYKKQVRKINLMGICRSNLKVEKFNFMMERCQLS